MSVPPPSFEKAVADRLSALPPKGHDVKGSSSSTYSHGCEFIFICRGKWPNFRSVQSSKPVFALHIKLNNFYLLCFIQLWILILTLFWGWGNMALQAQNRLFWKPWSGSKTVLGDSWYRLISFVFWVWLNLDSYHTVLSSCVWWMVPSDYLVSTQLQFWGFVVGAATKMS